MRVLHLFSNSKWTGPAEPALNLCVALRRLGVQAAFACAPDAKGAVNKVVETARDREIEPVLSFRLGKHRSVIHNWRDRRTLGRMLAADHYDVVHVHLDNAHRIARGPARKHNVPLVRSSYEGDGMTPRAARLLPGTDFLIQPSMRALEHDATRYGFPAERMEVVPGAVDIDRFDPQREVPDNRRWLQIPPNAFVVGIVARLQQHRHYEDFFQAIRRLLDKYPQTHAIVVGRGTKQEQVGREPVRRLGLEERVHFPGYVDGDNYVGMLNAFDAKVYLVPGSDGTCRAVREAMAMAKPVVVARRGMLPEIIDDNREGFVCDGSSDGLYQALAHLAADRARRHAMGQAARARALEAYSLDVQARQVLSVYERLLEGRP